MEVYEKLLKIRPLKQPKRVIKKPVSARRASVGNRRNVRALGPLSARTPTNPRQMVQTRRDRERKQRPERIWTRHQVKLEPLKGSNVKKKPNSLTLRPVVFKNILSRVADADPKKIHSVAVEQVPTQGNNGAHQGFQANSGFLIKGQRTNYYFSSVIGEGTFGKVYQASSSESGLIPVVAVKVLEKSRMKSTTDILRVTRECSILQHVRHRNVVRFEELVTTQASLFLVLELMERELYEHIVDQGRLDEQETREITQQVLNGVEYLHGQGIIHRDLKPENILLIGKQVKIADFGLSAVVPGCRARGRQDNANEIKYLYTCCGSPCYAAPELIAGVPYDGRKTDIWAIGVTLYAMLCGFLPFEDPDTGRLYEAILSIAFDLPSHLSPKAVNLIRSLLVFNPRARLYFPQLFEHCFFQSQQETTSTIR